MSSVNFTVKTQAHAYQEGMRDGMALLVTALEESGSINHLLEVLEWNARPADVTRLNNYYAARTTDSSTSRCATCGDDGHSTAEHASPLDAIPDEGTL